jgi:hypothetical protein
MFERVTDESLLTFNALWWNHLPWLVRIDRTQVYQRYFNCSIDRSRSPL